MSFLSKLKASMFGKAPDTSPSGKVDTTDIAKVVRTGLLLAGSTALTYILSNVKPDMFGDYANIATIVIAMLSEVSLRYIKNNAK